MAAQRHNKKVKRKKEDDSQNEIRLKTKRSLKFCRFCQKMQPTEGHDCKPAPITPVARLIGEAGLSDDESQFRGWKYTGSSKHPNTESLHHRGEPVTNPDSLAEVEKREKQAQRWRKRYFKEYQQRPEVKVAARRAYLQRKKEKIDKELSALEDAK